MLTHISVRGAREHNLKDVSVDIPRDTLTVITGIFCSCPLLRAVTVSVSLPETPVAIAILLNTLAVNHGGLR